MLRHAVVGVDFSPSSEALVACLGELRTLGTEVLTLVYVASVAYPGGSAIGHEAHYRERLQGLAEALSAHGFEVHTDVVVGYPAAELVATAERVGATLIVIGSRGESLVERWFLGSTAMDVVARAPVAVMLVRIEPTSPEACAAVCARAFARVLLATDLSAAAEGATRVALDLAETAEAFAIVSVLDAPSDADEATVRAQVRRLADERGVPATIHVVSGARASEHIAVVAEAEDMGVVVVGRRGHGALHDRLIGSTAEAVARRGEVSVLMVPDHPRDPR